MFSLVSDLRHSLAGCCVICLTLIMSGPLSAATLSANLRITTITTQAEKHARAIELDPEQDEDAGHDFDPNKMPGAAANPKLHRGMRIMLSPDVPFRVLIEGQHADAWRWQAAEDHVLDIRPLTDLPYTAATGHSLLTIIIRY